VALLFAVGRKLVTIALLSVGVVHAAGYLPALTTAYPQLAVSNTAPQIVWANCNSTGPWPSAYRTCDDGISQIMSIGFTFNFAGTSYSRWSMHSNGTIFFETNAVGTTGTGTASGAPTYQPANLPTTNFGSPAKPSLMPFWADLQKNASANGVLDSGAPSQPVNASFYQYQVLTPSPGVQVLVVQLKNVVYWNTSPQLYVNMQIQMWSTGQIVYSYGAMQAMTSNPSLRVGLQSAGGAYCHTLGNNQTTSLSNQSFVYTWDVSAPACGALATVNHYEIRHDGSATLCAEPITVLACSVGTAPCPAANIMSSIISIGSVSVTGVTNVSSSPPSFAVQSSSPTPEINLTWAPGSSGTASLGVSASVVATGATRCTNATGSTVRGNCNIPVANTACIVPPHHYEIQGPATGSTCTSQTFTVKAWADAAQTTAYTAGVATGTITQSGNPASLPSLGAFSIAAGSSTVSVTPITFPAGGTTTFGTTPALTGATTCKFGASTSCAFPVTACPADFNCVHTGTSSSAGTLLTKLAGTAFSFDVVARKADGTIETTYASDVDKSVTVELVDGSGATACASRTTLSPAVTSQTLTFAKASQATELGRKGVSFTVASAYQDVRCRVTDNTTPTIKGCSSDNFAVRPQQFVASSTTANANNAGTSTTATPRIKAGSVFSLNVDTSTVGYGGIPTINAGNVAAHSGAVQTGILTGTFGAANASTGNGATGAGFTYTEVGYFRLNVDAVVDASFTGVDSGVGDCVVGSSSNALTGEKYGCNIGNAVSNYFGRFTPDHFDTAVTQGCVGGSFTYSAQPFTVTATARNSANAPTRNYTSGAFAQALALSNAGVTTGMDGNALAATAFANGEGSANAVTFTFTDRQTLPTNLTLRGVDSDGVSSAGATEGTASIRSGRVRLFNAYGSERLDLPMTMRAEFWNTVAGSSGWQTNAADSCTTTNLVFTAVAGATDNRTATCVRDSGNPGASGMGCSAAGVAARQFREAGVAGFSGDFNLWLQAPQTSGAFNVTATVPIWLQFPWTGATAANPMARATFGVYKSPLIYRRENY
jgi:hypothetical protein